MDSKTTKTSDGKFFFAVPTLMLIPDSLGKFSIYIEKGDKITLLCKKGYIFTKEHQQRLYENDIKSLYIEASEIESYDAYVKKNLGSILSDPGIPYEERSKVFLDTTTTTIKTIFETNLPARGKEHDKFFEDLFDIINKSLDYLKIDEVIKNIGKMMSHDYATFTHSVHVFTFSIALLKDFYDRNKLVNIGAGILLHDIGKTLMPTEILNKPGPLTEKEFAKMKTHTFKGIYFCTNAPLSQEAYNVIIYHHEKLDGSGYPEGLTADRIPMYVRAVTICDIYDALISNRPYAPAMTPFDALKLMSKEFLSLGKIDKELFQKFILLLKG